MSLFSVHTLTSRNVLEGPRSKSFVLWNKKRQTKEMKNSINQTFRFFFFVPSNSIKFFLRVRNKEKIGKVFLKAVEHSGKCFKVGLSAY